jgi:hypothetical protein
LHLKEIKYLLILLTALVFIKCKDFNDDPDNKIVARVNRVALTEAEVNSALKTRKNNGTFQKEYIKNWVEKEILYKEAEENHVDSPEFEKILEESKKELTIAFFLNKYFHENHIKFNERELLDFYNENKDLYKLNTEAIAFNEIRFSDESKAILFRNTLLDSDWNKAMNVFRGDSSIISFTENRFDYYPVIKSLKLVKILKALNDGEVSIILEENPEVYLITQVINKFGKDQISEHEQIKKQVAEAFETLQKKRLYNQLMISLYSKYNVEIK